MVALGVHLGGGLSPAFSCLLLFTFDLTLVVVCEFFSGIRDSELLVGWVLEIWLITWKGAEWNPELGRQVAIIEERKK